MNTTRNRREADALARLLALLADGVAFDAAVWSATDRGMDMDTARLIDLFNGQRRETAAAAPATAKPTRTARPVASVEPAPMPAPTPRGQQPLELAAVPGALLRMALVVALTGLSRATLYRLMDKGEFPKSVQLSKHSVAWRQADVAAWTASRGAA